MQFVAVLLQDVMTGAVYKDVNLSACTNFTNVQKMNQEGVLQFASLFGGLAAPRLGLGAKETSCRSETAIMVEPSGTLQPYDKSYFQSAEFPLVQAIETTGSRNLRYGMVGGSYQHWSISSLGGSN